MFHQVFNCQCDKYTYGQYGQCLCGIGRYDTVINLHAVKRCTQGQHVDGYCGQHDFKQSRWMGKKLLFDQAVNWAIRCVKGLRQRQFDQMCLFLGG